MRVHEYDEQTTTDDSMQRLNRGQAGIIVIVTILAGSQGKEYRLGDGLSDAKNRPVIASEHTWPIVCARDT